MWRAEQRRATAARIEAVRTGERPVLVLPKPRLNQNSRENQDCLIINAGGYTHTSVAIHDALKILSFPIIELHITNIYKREEFRKKSLISNVATSIICGLGTQGYTLALKASINLLKK